MVRTILALPDKRLKQKAELVTDFDWMLELFVDLRDTCQQRFGLGLAAPQIGIAQRAIVIKRKSLGIYTMLVNPVWRPLTSERRYGMEGCLSIPGVSAEVERYLHIVVEYQQFNGLCSEFRAHDELARAVQHEVDHLDGFLFVDRLEESTKQLVLSRYYLRREVEKQERELMR